MKKTYYYGGFTITVKRTRGGYRAEVKAGKDVIATTHLHPDEAGALAEGMEIAENVRGMKK